MTRPAGAALVETAHHEIGNGIATVLAAMASEAEWLADGDDVRFMSEIARRMQDE